MQLRVVSIVPTIASCVVRDFSKNELQFICYIIDSLEPTMDSVEHYILTLPDERKEVISLILNTIREHLPNGFEECIIYNMPGWVVPHSMYPKGYHVDPSLPLPFLNVASQKNHIALYHMGVYSDLSLLEWVKQEYPNHSTTKLDMGKSCIRFKNINKIPYEFIAMLCTKMTPEQWIQQYESSINSTQ